MAVLQMQRIYICAMKKNRKKILEYLQRQGVIEISETIAENSVFKKADVSSAEVLLKKNITSARDAVVALEKFVPEKKPMLSVLNGRNEVSTKAYDDFYAKYDDTLRVASRINFLVKQIAEQKAEIIKIETQNEILTPWMDLDIPLNFNGTKYTSSFIGSIPSSMSLEMIYELLAESIPVNVDIISTSREQTCVFVLCQKSKADEVSNTLRAVGFTIASNTIDIAPARQKESYEKQIDNFKQQIVFAQEEIESYNTYKSAILFLEDYDTVRAEKYEVISQLMHSKSVFILKGFIPDRDKEFIETELTNKYEAAVEFEQPSNDEEVPVLLKNNAFAEPLESTVEAYSLPGKGEIDPTMTMSLFYYVLFGLMLSDAGYGAIVAGFCGFALIKFRKKLEHPMRKTLKMYFFCGVSTIFWGVMFGSYFGDILDVASATFFEAKVSIPALWFFPVSQPMKMLMFSLAIGIVHLFSGLGMKLYTLLKAKQYKDAFYDVGLWLLILTGSIVLLLSSKIMTDMFAVSLSIPAIVITAAKAVAILSAVGIVLTSGRDSKNPVKRIMKGLYGLYNLTGYLSDVLSYSRLLALGLATGVIASVINAMASMTGSGVVGAIAFTVICVGGHALNLGINALGAYVHTNRLQYVEFFGKFYDGGGRKFNPFSIKTKYYKFREE